MTEMKLVESDVGGLDLSKWNVLTEPGQELAQEPREFRLSR
jgi:hypothetical protein